VSAKFELGQRVRVNMANVLYRSFKTRLGKHGERVHLREWTKHAWQKDQFREGMVVGLRTYSNGQVYYHGYDGPTQYKTVESLRVVLVAFDVRQRPRPFLIDEVEAL